MSEKKDSRERLEKWQKLLKQDESAWKRFSDKFNHREELYFGSHAIKPVVENDPKRTTPHVRNIISELIEAQIDPTVPQPKVNGHTQAQEYLAKVVEDKLRNELDRLPMEASNDVAERIVRIQGGVAYMAEWDSIAGDHEHIGDLVNGFCADAGKRQDLPHTPADERQRRNMGRVRHCGGLI